MALGGLATVSTLLFLFMQFVQGLLLDVYLELYVCPAHSDLSQWYWVAVDGLLLFGWMFYLVAPSSKNKSPVKRKLCGVVPALAVGWAVYLAIVLLPRTVWVMEDAGRCLGKAGALRSSSIQSTFSDRIGNFSLLSQSTWGSNAWVTITSAGTTSLIVLLAVTGHADHGLIKQKVSLDFDLAEGAFAVIDGVEYWHAFFSAVEYKCKVQCKSSSSSSSSATQTAGHTSPSSATPTARATITMAAGATANTTAASGCSSTNSIGIMAQPTEEQLDYIRALDGRLGLMIILVASASFTLPFFALWEMQLKSEGKRIKANPNSPEALADRGICKKMKGRVQAIYIFFDLLLVNAPGFGVRIYLWLEYKQAISALITKNVLGIVFRALQIWVKFIQPQFHRGKKALIRRATRGRIDSTVLPSQPNHASDPSLFASTRRTGLQQCFSARQDSTSVDDSELAISRSSSTSRALLSSRSSQRREDLSVPEEPKPIARDDDVVFINSVSEDAGD